MLKKKKRGKKEKEKKLENICTNTIGTEKVKIGSEANSLIVAE